MNELVISKTFFRDKDILITTLSSNGVNSYILKNGQKLNAPFKRELDYLNIILVKVNSRFKLNYISEVQKIYQFQYIPTNYEKIKEAAKVINIVKDVVNVIDDFNNFYNFIIKTLKAIEYNDDIFLIFLVKLSYFLGISLLNYDQFMSNTIEYEIKKIYNDKDFIYQFSSFSKEELKLFLNYYYRDYFTLNL